MSDKMLGIEVNSQKMDYIRKVNREEKSNAYLYPHDTDNLVLIVPSGIPSRTKYNEILKPSLIVVWAVATVIVAFIRFICNQIRKSDQNLVQSSFLGMSFNSPTSSATENLLLWYFGTLLLGIFLSSSMYQGFIVSQGIFPINSVKDLEISGLDVWLPMHSQSVEYFFENISHELNLKFAMPYEISDMIQNRNTNTAYVIRESKFNILFSNDKDHWHVIERFGYEHLSYKIHLLSAIEHRMNDLIQRCVNHGIVQYLVEKNKRLLTGIDQRDQPKHDRVNVEPLSISDMRSAFFLFAFGLILSAATFLAEKLYFAKFQCKSGRFGH
ncbi:hypothetical protein Bhyg_08837 [Pseudolycoriella hygida]|uniref:Uncharacterized protein n=1 Tax=Pseudolycoriella hygida TaxID=35572 RepID=A0A9Q0S3C0_9DIPT|nr:hypothetical protein Bhyg_08837 [Pseudolycoriella hygida]